MTTTKAGAFVASAMLTLAACAHYEPHPIDLSDTATQQFSRALDMVRIATIREKIAPDASVISITFKEGSDPYRARQVVAEALGDAKSQLPAGVNTPILTPLVSSTMDLLKIGFTSDRMSPMALRDLVEWQVRPRLLAAQGVARANIYGGEQRRVEVQVRPDALAAHGVSLDDLASAVNGVVTPRGGGFADTPEQRILIVPDSGKINAQAISDAIISSSSGAGALRVGDVGTVVEGLRPASAMRL
ncbi:MAG: efflux RND transporter permease subunit [Sphingobium sp.]